MKPVRIHQLVVKQIESLDLETRRNLADLLALLQSGESLGMPTSRPMSTIEHGVHELRLKDRAGQYRVFYFTKFRDAILVFHMFKKKTQETPKQEIMNARRHLKELL